MQTSRASTRRAALAAFLLFAAGLFVVDPAEASRTTTNTRSSLASISAPNLAPSSSRELASLELSLLEPLEPADSASVSSRFGFGEDLSLLDVEARPCGFELFGGVGTSRCELTYARNNPVKYTDPDGRMWKLATGGNRGFLLNAMVQYVMRPSGRAAFVDVRKSATTVVVGTGSLNSKAAIELKLKTGKDPGVTFGKATAPYGGKMTMTLDAGAHSDYAGRTKGTAGEIDKAGVTTFGHETDHVRAGLAGGFPAMERGDYPNSASGPAMRSGQATFREQPDISEDEPALSFWRP